MRHWIDIVEAAIVAEAYLDQSRAPLFHFTTRYALRNILEADRLGSPRSETVSLTRDSRLPFKGDRAIVLVLNQDLLKRSYKLQPLYGDSPQWAEHVPARDESEERLQGPITGLHGYLERIVLSGDIAEEVREIMPVLDGQTVLDDKDRGRMIQIFRDAVQVIEYARQHGIELSQRDAADPLWARRSENF